MDSESAVLWLLALDYISSVLGRENGTFISPLSTRRSSLSRIIYFEPQTHISFKVPFSQSTISRRHEAVAVCGLRRFCSASADSTGLTSTSDLPVPVESRNPVPMEVCCSI
ncbi:hypothetical protein EXIGLDRAFT_441312 [Exidia glandulosa HHB12029]|uniref:Secreted protein n=1 Tax=Exidia glandulosa HHB12029 TaxID=1314781 RepID=A0A165B6P4_EXIGL|nr:hypothetical protein EXIGLDRAFT_441312 [Exidia glandulosa HHB12029]